MEHKQILRFNVLIFIFVFFSVAASAGDVTVDVGDVYTEKDNELFLSLKNTQVGGHDYRLVSAGSAGGIGAGKFAIYDATASSARLTIDANGKVGIGTMEPIRMLNVHSDDWGASSEIHASGSTSGFSFTNRDAGRTWETAGEPGTRWVLHSYGRGASLWTNEEGNRVSFTEPLQRNNDGSVKRGWGAVWIAPQDAHSDFAVEGGEIFLAAPRAADWSIKSSEIALDNYNGNFRVIIQDDTPQKIWKTRMLITPSGQVRIEGLPNCDTINTDASGNLVCGVDNVGLTSESDPQVGTLTSNKWCKAKADGTAIDCDQNTPAGDSDWTISGTDMYSGVTGKVGIGATIPKTKLDVAGEVKVGNTGLTCNSDAAGAIRYTGALEYCDGTSWQAITPGGGVPPPSGGGSFSEGFESGIISSNWVALSSPGTYGSIDIQTSSGCTTPRGGSYYLFMDTTTNGNMETNILKTNYDFTGATNIVLDFWHTETGDEQTSCGSTHTGNYPNCDGYFFTCDGNTWYKLGDLGNVAGWTNVNVNIYEHLNYCGSIDSNFAIKFTQYDNYKCTIDGRGLDDITISWS